jgi:LacI family transcriptional regulator
VTTATVSRVLNNRYEGFSVRPELREKIVTAAAQLGYRPHLLAQSLRKSSMGIVGLLGIHMPMIVPEAAVRGLVEVFEANDVKLTTYFSPTLEASHDLPPWKIDAAVVVGAMQAGDVAAVERAHLPYASINGVCGPHGIAVGYDDVDGTRQAMRHLLELGHRRIAYANSNSPWMTHPSIARRHETYLAVLAESGLAPVPGHEVPLPDPPLEWVRRTWEQGATAILAYHHFHAVHVLQAIGELGLRVPQDLSLMCFNDDYPTQYVYPPLTAVRLPTHEAGRIAAQCLLDQLATPQGPAAEAIQLKEELRARASTGPPPAQAPSRPKVATKPDMQT